MTDRKLQVLFLCAHNAARSIMAEAILNHIGHKRFRAHSAGVAPSQAPNTLTLEVLQQASIPTDGLRSKSWHEFEGPSAPKMDIVITMSNIVAATPTPVWAGKPIAVTWSFPDPLEAGGTDSARKEVFRRVMFEVRNRLELMVNLRLQDLEHVKLQRQLADMAP